MFDQFCQSVIHVLKVLSKHFIQKISEDLLFLKMLLTMYIYIYFKIHSKSIKISGFKTSLAFQLNFISFNFEVFSELRINY